MFEQINKDFKSLLDLDSLTNCHPVLIEQVSLNPNAKQCVLDRLLNETQKDNFSSIEDSVKITQNPESGGETENQERPDCKSGTGKISISVNLIDQMIKDQSLLVKERYFCRGKVASISDVVIDDPTFGEAYMILRERRSLFTKLTQLTTFYGRTKLLDKSNRLRSIDQTYDLLEEYKSLWSIIVDLYRTIIIYGYLIPIKKLRYEMINTWLTWSIQTSTIEKEKKLEVKSHIFLIQQSRWIKLVKYKLAAFAAWAKHSEILPKSPTDMGMRPQHLINKDFANWFKCQLEDSLQQRVWRMSLIDTLCRGVKKGADRSTDDDCLINKIETFNLFTTPKSKPTYNNMTVYAMEEEIKRSIDEIIVEPFVATYSHCPSFSSCSENSLQKGGHVKIVKEHVPKYPRDPIFTKHIGLFKDPSPLHHYNDTEEANPLCNKPLPSIDDGNMAIKKYGECVTGNYIEITTNPNYELSDINLTKLYADCLSKPSVIKLVALKEALKVRGITTPCALETWLLKPLQKFLAKQLLKHRCFAVTGQPLRPEHIENVIVDLDNEQWLLSGDYDNATNMMISSYTRCAIRYICQKLRLSTEFSLIAERSLCDCVLDFRFNHNNNKYHIQGIQQEAQPMGKILSFTLLCIINFAVCRKAVEMDQSRHLSIDLFPGLINGDDCCFPIRNMDLWVGYSSMVGLFNSVGKTFCSKDFVEMNSRTFILEFQQDQDFKRNIKFTEVPFINYGLMKGMVRSEADDDSRKRPITVLAEAVSRMGWCHQELVKDFQNFYTDLDYLFKFYHNKYLLSDKLQGVPYYVPAWLGGLGLHPGPNPELTVSMTQLMCAKHIYQNINQQHNKPASMTMTRTCLIDNLINQHYRELLCEESNFMSLELENGLHTVDLAYENQRAYGALVEYLWRSLRLNEFFKQIDHNFVVAAEKIAIRKLYKNSRIWKEAYILTSNEVLQWHKLWHDKRKLYKPIILRDAERDLEVCLLS